jgi:glutathione peroxidase
MNFNQNLWVALVVGLALAFTSPATAQKTPSGLDFTMKTNNGEEVDLSAYAGKAVLFVNVASKCGRTRQYEQLQALHEQYAEKGLAIVGVPCNQFAGQEPGSDEQILAFCKKNYGVEFDLLSKVDVNGENQCDLYAYLTGLDLKPRGKGAVKWNFEKILLDRNGTPVARFGSKTKPDDKEVVAAIESALATKSTTGRSLTPGKADASGHYSHTSEKLGREYYLFSKDVPLKNSNGVQTIYFFGKDPVNAKGGVPLKAVPEGKVVAETKTGMLILKNDGSKKKK